MQIHKCSNDKLKITPHQFSASSLVSLNTQLIFFPHKIYLFFVWFHLKHSSSFNFYFLNFVNYLFASSFDIRRVGVLNFLNTSNRFLNPAVVNAPSFLPPTSTLHTRFQCRATHQWPFVRCWRQSSDTSALLPSA